jgi:hypothetical protein
MVCTRNRVEWHGLDGWGLGQGHVASCCGCGNEPSGFLKCRFFFWLDEELSAFQEWFFCMKLGALFQVILRTVEFRIVVAFGERCRDIYAQGVRMLPRTFHRRRQLRKSSRKSDWGDLFPVPDRTLFPKLLFVCSFLARQPSVGQGLLIHEVSRSQATTRHSR